MASDTPDPPAVRISPGAVHIIRIHPGGAVEHLPPTVGPDPDLLVEEIAHMLVAIENNYVREGTGAGSRFAGQRLEVVQARAVIRRIREV